MGRTPDLGCHPCLSLTDTQTPVPLCELHVLSAVNSDASTDFRLREITQLLITTKHVSGLIIQDIQVQQQCIETGTNWAPLLTKPLKKNFGSHVRNGSIFIKTLEQIYTNKTKNYNKPLKLQLSPPQKKFVPVISRSVPQFGSSHIASGNNIMCQRVINNEKFSKTSAKRLSRKAEIK